MNRREREASEAFAAEVDRMSREGDVEGMEKLAAAVDSYLERRKEEKRLERQGITVLRPVGTTVEALETILPKDE